jgi:hypothetical protein
VALGVALAVGDNVITVTARDGAGNRGTDVIAITYDAEAPVCTITSPTTQPTYAATADRIDLAGSASDNVAVTLVAWTNRTTGASGTAVGTMSWSVSGIVVAEGANAIVVVARDADGNVGSDLITVTYSLPDTTPPVCRITTPVTNRAWSALDATVGLAGVASDDVGVTAVGWSNAATGLSGVAGGTATWLAADVALAAGENVIRVTARDAAGNAGFDAITITRLPSQTNDAPTADAGSDRSVPLRGDVALDGSGSSDPDGDALTYRWEQVSGPSAVLRDDESARTSFAPSEAEEYVFRLTVSDESFSSSDTVIVTVTDDARTLVVIPNRVAEELVDTVAVKGPPALRGKKVAVYMVSGAPAGDLTLDGDSARGGIAFPLDPGLYLFVAEADGERFIARLVVGGP